MLKNKGKEGAWQSDDEWMFTPQGGGGIWAGYYTNNLFYIENTSKTKVLGSPGSISVRCKVDCIVNEEVKVVDEHEQLWIKGEPDAEGYFTLRNPGYPVVRVLTAISESMLEIKGKE